MNRESVAGRPVACLQSVEDLYCGVLVFLVRLVRSSVHRHLNAYYISFLTACQFKNLENLRNFLDVTAIEFMFCVVD